MTRNFKQQRRDNARPFSRNSSPDRYEQRPSYPARSRPRRAAVDRAWEAGAPNNHADYRARRDTPQAPRNNWQRDRHASGARGEGVINHAPTNRNGHYDSPRTERPPYGNPRFQSAGTRPQRFDDRYPGNHRPRPDEERPYSRRREQYPREDEQHQSYRRAPNYRERQPADRRNPRWQSSPYDDRPPYGFNRHERFEGKQDRRGFNRRERFEGEQDRQGFNHHEHFEGDYERFETVEPSRRPAHKQARGKDREQGQERHVTRLPGGRVLKGPRQVQRQEAEFWTEVSQEAEALVGPISLPAAANGATAEGPLVEKDKSRKGKAAKGKKASSSSGPRPSQRGYKWPTS